MRATKQYVTTVAQPQGRGAPRPADYNWRGVDHWVIPNAGNTRGFESCGPIGPTGPNGGGIPSQN